MQIFKFFLCFYPIILSVLNFILISVFSKSHDGFWSSTFIIRVQGRKQRRRDGERSCLSLFPFIRKQNSCQILPFTQISPLVITAQNLNIWPALGFKEGSEITEHDCPWLWPTIMHHKNEHVERRNLCVSQ